LRLGYPVLNVSNEYFDINDRGKESWSRSFATLFGTPDAVFIEDNAWTYDQSFTENGANAVGANDGGQFVFRHNQVESWRNSQPIEVHGACAFTAGTRSFEIYANEFRIFDPEHLAWNALRFRSGD